MRKRLSTLLIILVFLTGLSLILYPGISNYINSQNQSRAIANYEKGVAGLNKEKCEQLLGQAVNYNVRLSVTENNWKLSKEELNQYNEILNMSNSGMMGYIDIPKIQCSLPIYHSTDEAVLQKNVGHFPGSSLPVGGESTHSVLSGHRGLPSAKLFSDLDKMEAGDKFMIRILNETVTYEVDQILIVLPNEMNPLKIEEGKDLCTLVTCTPYGVNSHRLLVRGHRVENDVATENVKVVADAIQIEPVIVAPVMALPVLLILVMWVLVSSCKKNDRRNQFYEDREDKIQNVCFSAEHDFYMDIAARHSIRKSTDRSESKKFFENPLSL